MMPAMTTTTTSPADPAAFAWGDDSTYHWTLYASKREISSMIGYFIGIAVAGPLVVYVTFWLIGLISKGFAFWLCVAAVALFLLTLVVNAHKAWRHRDPNRRKHAQSLLHYVAVVLLGSLLYLLAARESWLSAGFANSQAAGLGQWLLYFLDNTMSVFLLDVPEVFELRTSQIIHSDWVSRTITVIIRVLITLGLINLFVAYFQSRYQKQQIYGTVQDCYWHCEALPDADDMIVLCNGTITVVPDQREIQVKKFMAALKADADKEPD